MTYLTLLGLDRLSDASLLALGGIMECYDARLIAVIHRDAICARVESDLAPLFLATVHEVLLLESVAPFALIA